MPSRYDTSAKAEEHQRNMLYSNEEPTKDTTTCLLSKEGPDCDRHDRSSELLKRLRRLPMRVCDSRVPAISREFKGVVCPLLPLNIRGAATW